MGPKLYAISHTLKVCGGIFGASTAVFKLLSLCRNGTNRMRRLVSVYWRHFLTDFFLNLKCEIFSISEIPLDLKTELDIFKTTPFHETTAQSSLTMINSTAKKYGEEIFMMAFMSSPSPISPISRDNDDDEDDGGKITQQIGNKVYIYVCVFVCAARLTAGDRERQINGECLVARGDDGCGAGEVNGCLDENNKLDFTASRASFMC
jgi:hypothetical protein